MILRPTKQVRPGLATLRALVAVPIAIALLLLLPGRQFAHDIPSRVTVLAFVKPEAGAHPRLRVVLRVPLEAMRDQNFPQLGDGYLDVAHAAPMLHDAAKLWLANDLEMFENGAPLREPTIVATKISLPSDRSFTTYDTALAHIVSPAQLPSSEDLVWKQAMLDVVLDYPIFSAQSRFSTRPTLARLGVKTTTVLRFLPPAGGERDFEYVGDPGLVHLDPEWYQAAFRFVTLGFQHILSGIDHLLFILCLVIPFRRIRPLITIVTAFTIAHSITLLASAAGYAPDALWFPPSIEVLIAASIVYMALENIVGAKLERRWMVAFGFGLVHGFGFSFALRESLQFAGAHLATSLVSFNVGVELGQLMVLAIAVPVLNWMFTHVVAERMGTIILSAFVAHTAWHWMLDRGAALMQYQFEWPALTWAMAATVVRGAIAIIAIGIAGWGTLTLARRLSRATRETAPAAPGGEAE